MFLIHLQYCIQQRIIIIKKVIILFLFFIFSLSFVHPYLTLTSPIPNVNTTTILDSSAASPFKFRIGTALLIRTVSCGIGLGPHWAIVVVQASILFALMMSMLLIANWDPIPALLLFVGLVVSHITGGFIGTMSKWAPPQHLYDLGAILATTLGLLVLQYKIKEPAYFLLVVFLFSFNKETVIWLLPIAFILWLKEFGGLRALFWTSLSIFICIVVRLLIIHFQGEGSMVINHLSENWYILTTPHRAIRLFLLGGGLWIGLFYFHIKEWIVIASMVAFIGIQGVFGVIDELRIYGEIMPILAIGTARLIQTKVTSYS